MYQGRHVKMYINIYTIPPQSTSLQLLIPLFKNVSVPDIRPSKQPDLLQHSPVVGKVGAVEGDGDGREAASVERHAGVGVRT